MAPVAAPTQPPFERTLRFGRFLLDPARKQLLADGVAVRLGGRALDLLIALVERAGDVVSHDELFARVWPRTVVEESSLRVHLSALRKVLGEGPQVRYIASVPGRGYSFVMGVSTELPPTPAPPPRPNAPAPTRALPSRLATVIGRDEVLDALAARLQHSRLVTLVGPGGIGKTTVALALAERVAGGTGTARCLSTSPRPATRRACPPRWPRPSACRCPRTMRGPCCRRRWPRASCWSFSTTAST